MVNTAALPSVSAREGQARGSRLRVLCVDDHRDVADSTALLLRGAGFEARACHDGRTALQLAVQFRPGVCLLDLTMPGMDGDELAQRLLAQPGWRPLLLVAVTAVSDESYRQRTTAAGFHLHLVKPVEPEKLLAMVESFSAAATGSGEPVTAETE
jgi:CheY-like chemotaxis protein